MLHSHYRITTGDVGRNCAIFGDSEPSGSKRIDNLLPARLSLHQVIKGSFDVIQPAIELLDHVRFQAPLDQARKFLPQEFGQNFTFLLVVLCVNGRSVCGIDERV